MNKRDFSGLYAAIGVGAASVVLAALFAACATTAPAATASSNIEVAPIDDITIDWKGRNVGAELPLWVKLAAMGDPNDELRNLGRLNGNTPIVLSQSGANLPLLESWVNTQAAAQTSQQIRTAVSSKAQTALEGDLKNADAVNMANQFTALYSKATIRGLKKEMDTWIKTRSKATGIEKYTYYVLYSLSQADLHASIAETFKNVEANSPQQQRMKEKLEAQMNDLMESVKF